MMMKFTLAFLTAFFSVASASISSDSAIGSSLLKSARRVNENNQEADLSWVSGYDIKYQGCHHIKQWNANADDQNDVRIFTKRLVRFRLCPSGECLASSGGGCSSSFGDYIIDMDEFVASWYEAKMQSNEKNCEYFLNYQCDCNDDDGKGDDFNPDYCEYDCFNDAGMQECIEENPYVDDDNEKVDVEDFLQCAQLNPNNGDDANGAVYYVGPYCSGQGGAIKLGVFTDDSCTEFAEKSFYTLMGYELPYTDSSIVGQECLSCLDAGDDNQNQNNNGDAAAAAASEECQQLYQDAGKCEKYLPEGTVAEQNTQACNYMEGVKIVRADGLVDVSEARPSAVATAFIVIFAMAFAAMAFYVWYLRTRLGVKKNALL
jgi:hypothetical protein